jgi:hypothetical protein
MPDQTKKRAPRTTWIVLALVAALILFFILDCSGILFPVMNPSGSFRHGFEKDFGIKAPTALNFTHAPRVATRDPAYFYEATIAPSDIPSVLLTLTTASKSCGYTLSDGRDEKRFSLGGPEPDWYTPDKYPDIQKLLIALPNGSASAPSASAYWFFFSHSANKCWVYWFST